MTVSHLLMDLSHLHSKQVRFHSRASAGGNHAQEHGHAGKSLPCPHAFLLPGGHTPRCLPCIFGDPTPISVRIHHTCRGDWLFSRYWCTQLDLKLTSESDDLFSIGEQTFLKSRVRGPEGLGGRDELWLRPVYGIAHFLHGPGYHQGCSGEKVTNGASSSFI